MTYTNIVMHYPNIIILRYQMYNTEDEVKIILENNTVLAVSKFHMIRRNIILY